MIQRLSREYKYTERFADWNLRSNKQSLPTPISVGVQHETIDVGIAAARHEFWMYRFLHVSCEAAPRVMSRDLVDLCVNRIDRQQL